MPLRYLLSFLSLRQLCNGGAGGGAGGGGIGVAVVVVVVVVVYSSGGDGGSSKRIANVYMAACKHKCLCWLCCLLWHEMQARHVLCCVGLRPAEPSA